MRRKALVRGLSGVLAAGLLCLTPMASYVNAAEQGYVQTTERATEFYGANANEQDFKRATDETKQSSEVDAIKKCGGQRRGRRQ